MTRVFLTGDTRGYIDPCGCEQGQFGGLPGRATALRSLRRREDVLIDLGNLVQGTREHDFTRLKYVFRGLEALRYDAIVPGEGELAFGARFERLAGEARGLRFVCANLSFAESGERVFAPYALIDLPRGKRIALVGLTSPFQKLPARYRVAEPQGALRAVLPELRGKVDGVLVGGYLCGKPALELADGFPGVAAVLASFVPRGSPDMMVRRGAPAMFVAERGQYLGWMALDANCGARGGGQVWLGEEIPSHPAFAKLVAEHDREVSIPGAAFRRAQAAEFRRKGRVGSEACLQCHATEYEAWRNSAHAHAVATLENKHQDRNPNCVVCHHNDLARHGAQVAGVGCESCHGGGAAHIAAHRAGGSSAAKRMPRRATPETCVACHDETNSSRFDLDTYWKRIAHGGSSGRKSE